jgi:recombination protein RecT
VATKEVQQTNAPARNTMTISDLSSMLETHKNRIAGLLPPHIKAERVIALIIEAISRSQLLLRCSPLSIVAALLQASILGLETDNLTGEAYLIPYWNSKVNGYEAQLQVGYKGLVRLARNTGEFSVIDSQAVHVNDHFEPRKGSHPEVIHYWDPKADRGAIYGYYGVFTLKDGSTNFEFMTVDEIERHRDKYSQSAFKKDRGQFVLDQDGHKVPDGPWNTSPEWMFRKTPLIQVLKLAPKSRQLSKAITLDEQSEAGLRQHFVDVPPELNPGLTDDDAPDEATEPKAKEALTDGNALITSVQLQRLGQIAKENGWSPVDLSGYLKKQYSIESTQQLPAREFDGVIEILQMGRDPGR